MLEVVGERVGGWCGRDSSAPLRRQVRPRRRYQNEVYAKLEADVSARNAALFRMKDEPAVPAPRPVIRPPTGLACAKCAPLSRESWQDPKPGNTGAVINILDIGRQTFANGGVVSRYLCDLAQCCHLIKYDYKDVVPSVVKDERFQAAIEEKTRSELAALSPNGGQNDSGGSSKEYTTIRRKVEAKAMKVLRDISSAMSNHVLRLVAWLCHKAIRRVASGGCGTRAECVERLQRAKAAGLPLVFVPLHRSHFDYILVTFTLYLTGLRPPLVAAGDNMRIPFFGWFLRGCGAFYIRRRIDGSEYHGDPIYKSALRAYILNSLAANNNLEFFIEGGRTRTGKPQPPKAGILSVIMDAYLDGTINDALLVPVTLNYDRLVDGNFVREQLGMPKQMETFWSALRGIWRTLNTNHGSIRVDFNQPISLKELVTSFQKYNYLRAPIERGLAPANGLVAPGHQVVTSNSHSSLYGDDVSDDHKVMVEAIGRHLVYDAARATALMCTNVVAYVLLTERRNGSTMRSLLDAVEVRVNSLRNDGRDLGTAVSASAVLSHALDMLGRGLVRREGSGDKATVKPHLSIAASLELSYYANAVVAHYAAPAIVATALETIVQQQSSDSDSTSTTVEHDLLVERSLDLCSVLSQEFILCAPCTRLEDPVLDAVTALIGADVLVPVEQTHAPLAEQQWSQRYARNFDDSDSDEAPRKKRVRYTVNDATHARAERRRLILTLRPLLEAYAATCRSLRSGAQSEVVAAALRDLTEAFERRRMHYGEAVSTDAIKNCLRLLRHWGALLMYTEGRQRRLRLCPPYDSEERLRDLCDSVCRFNVATPLLDK